MARIQKKSPKLDLSKFQTLIVDNKTNSEYFRLSEIPDTLTSGKNGFLIEGSTFLKPTTEIKIEVLDTEGNPLYVQPGEGIPEYYEGLSKLISIHVYEDTPIGIGKITILGEAETYIDENGIIKTVPDEWTGVYNVKWEKEIKINKNLLNESKVRFIKRPEIIIEELGESFYSKNVLTGTQTNGTVRGISVKPELGTNLQNYAGGIIYHIENKSVPFVDGAKNISIVGTQIQSASIIEYINQYKLVVKTPHTSSPHIVGDFDGANYILNYQYIDSTVESSLFGSFARFEINNLATFVGDVERIKLYGKSNASSADFNLLYDARITPQNLLETVISSSIIDRGFFSSSYGDSRSWNTYWLTQSLSGTGQISLDTNDLYKSVKFRNYKVKSNVGNDVRLERGSEYTLEFYVYYKTPSQEFISNKNDKLKVYVSSGLRQGNGLTPNYYFTTSLDVLSGDNKWRTPTKISYNFIPNVTDDWTINFESENQDTILGDTFWQVGSVKIFGANELGYSPDEFGFTIPIQRQIEQETFDFRLEYYDLNNNFVPIQNTATQTFVSGNLTLLGKNLSVDADKLFFTFDETSDASPKTQEISINAYKTRLVGNLLITSQAFDSGGLYISPASFLGTTYPGNLTNRYEDLNLFSGSLKIADFTGSLHGAPPGPGNVIVDKILYTFTEAGSTQPQSRRLSISRVLTNTGTGSIGAAGADAKTVNLTSNIYAIPYGSDGTEVGANNIFLTASQQNHNGVVYYEFLKDGIQKQNTTSEYYSVLNADKPNTGSRNSWRVNTREGSNTGTVIAFDTIDLFGLKDGASGWTVFLTNNTTAFPASANGVVNSADLNAGITDVVFYRGTSSFTFDQSSPYDINSYRTGSITSSANISFTTSIVNNRLRIIPTSINTNGGVDLSGSIIIPLIDNFVGIEFRPVYTFTISKQGATGLPGASGSDAIVVSLVSDKYGFNYNGNGFLTPLAQSSSLTASAQTGSKSWGAEIYYQFQKNGINKQTSTSPYYIISSSEIPSAGNRDLWKVNLLSGSGQSQVAFDTLDIYGLKDGGDAKTVILNSPYYVITYNANNTLASPSSLFKVTASAQNFTNPYFRFTGDIDVVEGTYTAGSSSNEDTASFTPPSTYFSVPKSIRVGVAESYNSTQEVAYDTITIAAVKPGSDGINGLIGELYYIKPLSGTQIKNGQGTLEIQAIYVSGNISYDLNSGSVVLTTGSSANSVLQSGNGVTAGSNGVSFNAILNSNAIQGSRTIILKDTGSNKVYDTITLVDVTDGLGGGSALSDTLIFRRDSGSAIYTPSTASVTASFFGTNDVEYQERYKIYPYLESGIDKMYFTIETDSPYITASVDNGDGIGLGVGFINRNSTKDLNFTFEFRDPQINSTSSFVETFYIISDGGDGEDAYTVLLTNENHSLPTDNAGVVNYGGSGTTIIAYKGATELNGVVTGAPVTGQFSASFEVSSGSITVGTITSPGNPIVVGDHSNMITTSSLIRFTINLEGTASFTKIQSLAKAIEGDDGVTLILTNDSHTFPSDEQGNVASSNLEAGATEIRFFRGTTQYQHDQSQPYATNSYRTGSITASSNIVFSQSIVTTDGIQNVKFTPTSVSGLTTLTGSLIIPVIENVNNSTSASFTKIYTFSISKAGTSGSNALSIILNPNNQSVSKSKAGSYQSPVTFSVQVFETGSALLYTGSNNTLQSGYFTIHLRNAGGTLVPATGSISASIAPPLVTTDSGVSSSFAVQYRDSKGNLSSFISQSHFISVVREGNDGINGTSGSDAKVVSLTSNRYVFTYNGNNILTPLTSQTASLTASAQTGSASWGSNIFYEWLRNGTTISPANYTSPFWIVTGSAGPSPIPSAGTRDLYQVNLRSGSGQTLVAFDNIDIFGLKDGGDAKTVTLNSPNYIINYNSNNTLLSPTSLFKVTASAQNFVIPFFRFTGDVDSVEGTYTAGSSSNEDTASFTPPSTYFTTPKSIRVGVAESSNPTVEIAYDTITIAAVKPGADTAPMYFIRPLSGTQIRNNQGTLEIQAVMLSGSNSFNLQSGSIVFATGSSAGSVLTVGNGVTAGPNGVNFNAIFNSNAISGSRIIYLKDTGSNVLYDTITLIDVTDGIGGGSGIASTLVFRRDSGSIIYTPSTASLTASFFGTNDVEYQERYRVYPYFENGVDKMYATLDTDSPFITASIDDGGGLKTGLGFANRISTKDLNFTFEFRDPQINSTGSFVETLYIISDGGDGEDAYTVILTNESHNLATTNKGVVDYNGSGTNIIAYRGATELNGVTTGVPISGQFSASFEVASGSITVGTITSPGNPVVVGNHSNMTTTSSLIRFTINLEGSASFTKLQSLAKAIEGDDGYTVFLTNEAHTFPADDLGNVSSANLSNGVTDVRFFRGTTQYIYNQTGGTGTYKTGSITASFNITASQTIVNNDVRFTPVAVTGSSQLSGSIIIPLIDNETSTSFTKIYTFSISKAGISGSNALSILLNPSNQTISKSQAGLYQRPVTFSVQVFETGSPLLYTGSNNTLQSGYFTVFLSSGAGTLVPATGSISASIAPPLVTTDSGVSSSFAVVYRDSKGTLSSHISQSHRVVVVSDGLNGTSGSDAFAVNLVSNRYTFTYDQNGTLTPLAQTASLTASAQTGSASKPWGANTFYEFVRNGVVISPASYNSPFWIVTGSGGPSPIPVAGGVDVYQVNLRSGSASGPVLAFDSIDLFGLRSGSDGYTVFLTNEAHTFPADDQGNVSSANLTSGLTDVRFFRGSTQYTYNQTGGTNTYKTGSITVSSNISVSQSILNNDVRIIPTSVSGLTQLSGSVVIPIIDNTTNVTFTKTYTFGISRAGSSGSNAINILINPSVQTVTASLTLGTYSTASRFNVFVYETGSAMRYTTTQPPTTRGTWTIYMSAIGSNGTNNSINNEISGTITPPTISALRPFTSSFAVQYLDSKGNLSSYISQSHQISVVSIGQTGPGIVFTGPWSGSRTYQYSEGSANGRRDVIYETSSGVYYAALQQHVATGANKPPNASFWQSLGTEDYFVAAKIAIFEESYVQNTLNVGTNNYEAGFSAANITLAGGTPNPYISIGQSSQGYGLSGIWIGNTSSKPSASFVNAAGDRYLKWDSNTLDIRGIITASAGYISDKFYVGVPSTGITLDGQAKTIYIGAGNFASSSTGFFVSSSGDFSLGNSVVWRNSNLNPEFKINSGSVLIGKTSIDKDGLLFTENAIVKGTVESTSGNIGGWAISADGIKGETTEGSIELLTGTTLPSIKILSGSLRKLSVILNAASTLSNTSSAVLGTSPNSITTSQLRGSSNNNAGTDISGQYSGLTAIYTSGSTTRLTGSSAIVFDVSASFDNELVTINLNNISAVTSNSASFKAQVDTGYYIASTTFTLRYGFALYSASINGGPPVTFIDAVSRNATGGNTLSSSNRRVTSNATYTGSLVISKNLKKGTYHIVPFVDNISISATAAEEGPACNCPSYGTFAGYGNCVGSQQEVYRYTGGCDSLGNCETYTSYEGACL